MVISLILGYIIYFSYGIRKSHEGELLKQEKRLIKSDGRDFQQINRVSFTNGSTKDAENLTEKI